MGIRQQKQIKAIFDGSLHTLHQDMMALRMLVFQRIIVDAAYFNRNPQCKIKQYKGRGDDIYHGNEYHRQYWLELLQDLKSDWFKAYCLSFGLNVKDTVRFILSNKHTRNSGNMDAFNLGEPNVNHYLHTRKQLHSDKIPRMWIKQDHVYPSQRKKINVKLDF